MREKGGACGIAWSLKVHHPKSLNDLSLVIFSHFLMQLLTSFSFSKALMFLLCFPEFVVVAVPLILGPVLPLTLRSGEGRAILMCKAQ